VSVFWCAPCHRKSGGNERESVECLVWRDQPSQSPPPYRRRRRRTGGRGVVWSGVVKGDAVGLAEPPHLTLLPAGKRRDPTSDGLWQSRHIAGALLEGGQCCPSGAAVAAAAGQNGRGWEAPRGAAGSVSSATHGATALSIWAAGSGGPGGAADESLAGGAASAAAVGPAAPCPPVVAHRYRNGVVPLTQPNPTRPRWGIVAVGVERDGCRHPRPGLWAVQQRRRSAPGTRGRAGPGLSDMALNCLWTNDRTAWTAVRGNATPDPPCPDPPGGEGRRGMYGCIVTHPCARTARASRTQPQ